MEDFACWVALHAAGVPGEARDDIVARGPCAALADGVVRGRRFDPIRAVARARAIIPFVESGGQVLGAAQAASLGRMAQRSGAPLCAFARGAAALARVRPAVAVVGSREATPRGVDWTRRIVESLVGAGAVIVSGGARGIDRAAHEAALLAGGRTMAVLGEPVRATGEDERPPWLREPFDADPSRALSLTVFGPWVRGARHLFAARNHWIAAVADAVIVVEGRAGSGTRHTAAAARALGVPLWAVVGDFETSRVPNALLEARQASWLDPEDAARQVLGRRQGPRLVPPPAPAPRAGRPQLTLVEAPLLRAIREAGGRLLVDDAARRLGQSVRDLLPDIALLELDGALRREGPHLVVPPVGAGGRAPR